MPELVTSLQAARKDHAGIAIGNIVGSNIFNILFIAGGVSLICPVPFESKFYCRYVCSYRKWLFIMAFNDLST